MRWLGFAGDGDVPWSDDAGASDARHLRRVCLRRLGPYGRWGSWRREVWWEVGADMEGGERRRRGTSRLRWRGRDISGWVGLNRSSDREWSGASGGMEGSGQLSCAVIDGLFVATVRVNGLETWPMVAYNGALDPQTFQNLQPKTLLQLQASAIETGGFLLPLKKL
jgi:hypothetical protein